MMSRMLSLEELALDLTWKHSTVRKQLTRWKLFAVQKQPQKGKGVHLIHPCLGNRHFPLKLSLALDRRMCRNELEEGDKVPKDSSGMKVGC